MQPEEQNALSPPQSYIAQAVSILYTTLNGALRSMGLRLKVADDSLPAQPTPSADPGMESPKQALLQEIGAKVDRSLQDASTADPHARQVVQEAIEEDRLARHNPVHEQLLRN